jgi:UDPglucose 6-dehydrogenase
MARIVIVGSGVVGQATGKSFVKEKGHSVRFVDIDPDIIERLLSTGLVAMTASQVDWNDVDIVRLAVRTPSADGRVILDHIEAAALDVGRGLATTNNFVTVVVRSTVPPSTTEKRITPILERASGKRLGSGFGAAMNPEFLRAVSNEQDFAHPGSRSSAQRSHARRRSWTSCTSRSAPRSSTARWPRPR